MEGGYRHENCVTLQCNGMTEYCYNILEELSQVDALQKNTSN